MSKHEPLTKWPKDEDLVLLCIDDTYGGRTCWVKAIYFSTKKQVLVVWSSQTMSIPGSWASAGRPLNWHLAHP